MPNKEEELAKKQADHFGVDFVSLRGVNIPFDVLNIISENEARKHQLVVYRKEEKTVYIAVADAQMLKKKAPDVLVNLKKEKGVNFKISITTNSDLMYALLGYKQKGSLSDESDTVKVGKSNESKKTVDLPMKMVSLKDKKIPAEILKKFPEKIASKYRMVVFEDDDNGTGIKVAVEDPNNIQTQEILDFVKKKNNLNIDVYKSSSEDIDDALLGYKEEIEDQVPLEKPNKKIEIQDEKPQKGIEKKDGEPKTEQKLDEVKNVGNVASTNGMTLNTDTTIEKKDLNIDEDRNLDKMLPSGVKSVDNLIKIIRSGSIPKSVAAIIFFASEMKASDIHIEPSESKSVLRFRLDGVLKTILKMPSNLHAPIVSRVKILSKLKIDEQRVPQDGRFDVTLMNKDIDLRVSTLPVVNGEKVVMRLLDKTTGLIGLDKLGLKGLNLERLSSSISKPYGIVLVTGPTGSGKTTTLYAVLNKLNKEGINIVTLEDPVEYELEGINQCQIKPKIGFGFADGLRSILRQDPNIIMVGEIRDSETANMATHSALTGHLVLSTLHTNDSAGALPRLIDMGVEPYLITSSINAIVAQRLVRKLCPKCRYEEQLPDRLRKEISEVLRSSKDSEIKKLADNPKFYKAKGCSECKDGFKGRIGLYEVLEITDRIEQLAVNRATSSIIKRAALNQGLVTIRQDGFAKAAIGLTSVDEVIRVASK